MDVYGISTDDVLSQKAFAKEQELNFPLLSDPNAGVARAYRALMEKRPFAQRLTFVIDPAGVLRAVDRGVKVDSHGSDLVALLERLQAE